MVNFFWLGFIILIITGKGWEYTFRFREEARGMSVRVGSVCLLHLFLLDVEPLDVYGLTFSVLLSFWFWTKLYLFKRADGVEYYCLHACCLLSY